MEAQGSEAAEPQRELACQRNHIGRHQADTTKGLRGLTGCDGARRESNDSSFQQDQLHSVTNRHANEPRNRASDPSNRALNQSRDGSAGRVGTQAVSPESRSKQSRTVNRIRRDMQSHIQAISSKGLGNISYTAAQNMSSELTAVEERVDKVIRVFRYKVQTPRGSQELSQEQNEEGGGDSLKRVPLPMFNDKHEAWADFRRGFRALQGTCNPLIEKVCFWTALLEVEINFITGVFDPVEVWFVLDRQYGKTEMSISRTVGQLLAL